RCRPRGTAADPTPRTARPWAGPRRSRAASGRGSPGHVTGRAGTPRTAIEAPPSPRGGSGPAVGVPEPAGGVDGDHAGAARRGRLGTVLDAGERGEGGAGGVSQAAQVVA